MSRTVQAAAPAHTMTTAKTSWLARILTAHALWQQRQRLVTLDDAALCDMGISRAQASHEAAKPLWNAPDQWLR